MAEEPPPFELLRYEEDYSHLHGAESSSDPVDQLKHIALGDTGDAILSLGGEARLRYEYFDDPAFGQELQDENGVFLQRTILHADLHLGPHVRFFGQLLSAWEMGRASGPSPVDENRLDVQNAFIDLSFEPADGATLTLRAGRQELSYGSARIVGVRDGPNVRRTFDGARAILDIPDWRIDALYARPRRDEFGVFDDGTDNGQALWGVYAVVSPDFWPTGNIDLYYLGYESESAVFDQGMADETRHSIGIRVWGEDGPWDWNWEAIYQFGRFGHGDIRAWTFATDTGFTWREAPWTPRLAINVNIASGDDDPGDGDLGTFNALFPRGSYFSQAAVLGPRNFVNLHPFLTIQPLRDLSLTADVNFFWRIETEDGVYGPSGQLLRSGADSEKRFVGSAISTTAAWRVDRYFDISAIYSHFFPGAFIRETGPAEDIDFVEVTARFRF